MPRTVNEITKALKIKATPKENALTLRVGLKKYTVPFEVRMLNSDEFIFLHIPPAAAILSIQDGKLVAVESEEAAKRAQASFRTPRRRTAKAARASTNLEIPAEVAAALSKLPAGTKLTYDANGKPRLVRTRKRNK